MPKAIASLILAGLLCLAASFALAQSEYPIRRNGDYYCPPPRFQIFEAPGPYGGLIMVDTETGESWQRVIVNTDQGIAIRWMKLDPRGPQKGETILWE